MTITHLPSRVEANAPAGCVTAIAIVQQADISYRQLDYWTRTGLLTPVGAPDPGPGSPRYFPTEQLHRAATIRWLLNAGVALQTCRAVIDELLDTGQVQLTDGLVIHLPETL